MNKLTDVLVSYLLKGGILGEARNIETTIDVPDSNIKITIKAEHVTVKVIKEDKENKKEA